MITLNIPYHDVPHFTVFDNISLGILPKLSLEDCSTYKEIVNIYEMCVKKDIRPSAAQLTMMFNSLLNK